MSVRKTHNRKREMPHGRVYEDVLRKAKAFNTTSVYLLGEKTIYHDDFEMHPYKNMDGKITWFCTGITLKPFKKPEGTKTFHWNIKNKKWEEVL